MLRFGKSMGSGVDWLVVCLGNPGDKYDNTRHNVGFMVGDVLAKRHNTTIQKLKYKALTTTIAVGDQKVLLMKPMTYMNLSGEAVVQATQFFKLPPDHVIVLSDDVALPPGKLRIRAGGGAGGHNGLKNITLHLGTDQYPRIRVGVGDKPHPDYDMANWVLSKLTGPDKVAMTAAIDRAADAVEAFVSRGIDRAMAQFN